MTFAGFRFRSSVGANTSGWSRAHRFPTDEQVASRPPLQVHEKTITLSEACLDYGYMSRISTAVKLLDQRFGFEKTTARSRKLLSKKRASSAPLPLICQGRSKTRPQGRRKNRPEEQAGDRGLPGRRASGASAHREIMADWYRALLGPPERLAARPMSFRDTSSSVRARRAVALGQSRSGPLRRPKIAITPTTAAQP